MTGELVSISTLAAREEKAHGTYHSHTWIGKMDDRVVIHWTADREQGAVVTVDADQSLKAHFKNIGDQILQLFWRNPTSGEELPQASSWPPITHL